jgi:hypothetical protein
MFAFAATLLLIVLAAGAHRPDPLLCTIRTAVPGQDTGTATCAAQSVYSFLRADDLTFARAPDDDLFAGLRIALYDGSCGAPDGAAAVARQPLSQRPPGCRRYARLPLQLLALWVTTAVVIVVIAAVHLMLRRGRARRNVVAAADAIATTDEDAWADAPRTPSPPAYADALGMSQV